METEEEYLDHEIETQIDNPPLPVPVSDQKGFYGGAITCVLPPQFIDVRYSY